MLAAAFAGPGLNNWDVALLKDTLIKESLNLEFRAELFNAFNHAQFGQPWERRRPGIVRRCSHRKSGAHHAALAQTTLLSERSCT